MNQLTELKPCCYLDYLPCFNVEINIFHSKQNIIFFDLIDILLAFVKIHIFESYKI